MIHHHRATVKGNGRFPVAMLWYDRCWPYSEEDAANVAYSLDRSGNGPLGDRLTFTITVVQASASGQPGWTPERWASFGWTLGEVA